MKPWQWVLLTGSLLTVALAVGSVYLIDHFAATVSPEHLASMGTIGDMFGLLAAIFAGLGFVGLAAALVFDAETRSEDLEDRRRARLPFVVPTISEQGAEIDRAEWPRQRLEVDLRLRIGMENLTAEPVLDLRLAAEVLNGGDGAQLESDVSDSPLGSEKSREGYVALLFKGEDALRVVRQLRTQQQPIVLRLKASYKSLNGAGWKSQVDYKLSSDTDDVEHYASISDPASEYTITPPGPGTEQLGGNSLFLHADPLPGTWRLEKDK